jgi:hypothetical protein
LCFSQKAITAPVLTQLGKGGRRNRPFGGERLNPALHGKSGLGAVAVKAFTCSAMTRSRESCFRLLADFFIAHDRTAASSSFMTAWMMVSSHASRQSM